MLENEDGQEDVVATEEETTEETKDDDYTDWQARAQELEQKAIKQREKTKELKAKLAEYEKNTNKSKTEEPDLARITFFELRGVTNPDDQKLVNEEAARLKMPLTDILGMEHIKAKLQAAKDQREAQAGMPKGGSRGNGKTQADVDYWLAKGDTPDDLELAGKVIEARMKKEQNKNMFSDTLYTG